MIEIDLLKNKVLEENSYRLIKKITLHILDKKLCVIPSQYSDSELLLLESKIKYLETIPQPEQRTEELYKFRQNVLTASNAWKAFVTQATKNQLIY